MTSQGPPEQLALLRERVEPVRTTDPREVAPELPVARVAVDVPLAHLDRPFDYLVPAPMHADVVVGCRVRVRFAGKLVGGFVLERVAKSDHEGRLGALSKVVSAEAVLRPEVAATVRAVADRYAGTFADVVRLAVPPRHARTEKAGSARGEPTGPPPERRGAWEPYDGGQAFVQALADGSSPRACWNAVPAPPPEQAVAEAVAAVVGSGRGAVVCVPDNAGVARMAGAFEDAIGSERFVVLTAETGPSVRYRAFLAAARGHVPVVLGTRAAAFAPVHDLGLVAIWDDGNDLHAEQRAPYPHAREVLLTRALESGSAVLVGGYARTCEAELLVESGWCTQVGPSALTRRRSWPRVDVAGPEESARDLASMRLPQRVFRALREGLASGPVLVQVPRTGYRPGLTCRRCRTPARCTRCEGPLGQPPGEVPPRCRWCGHSAGEWTCTACGERQLRSTVVGDRRTAEELGRSFPNTVVRTSSGDSVLDTVPATPAIVVATPGAEPTVDGGYTAAILLDTWLMLGRPDLRTGEESLRRWLSAVALVRGNGDGGQVVAVADPGLAVVQALVRLDPVGHAGRELADRRAARLPPAARLATVEGPPADVDALVDGPWPDPVEVLGPVPVEPAGRAGADEGGTTRLIVVVPRHRAGALSARLKQLHAQRSARKLPPLRIRVDPAALG